MGEWSKQIFTEGDNVTKTRCWGDSWVVTQGKYFKLSEPQEVVLNFIYCQTALLKTGGGGGVSNS